MTIHVLIEALNKESDQAHQITAGKVSEHPAEEWTIEFLRLLAKWPENMCLVAGPLQNSNNQMM